MKNYLIILCFLFSCKKDNLNNNNADIFVDNNKVWYVSYTPDPCPSCNWPHKVILGKDTIIKSVSYKLILDYTGDSIENNIKKPNLLGYIRETNDKKVYWLTDLNSNEILLYDFNLKLNDSNGDWIATIVDTFKFQNYLYKRIVVKNKNCGLTKIWIDGIGDMTDILGYNSQAKCLGNSGLIINVSGAGWYRQTCVLNGSDYIYKDTMNSECWYYKGFRK